MFANSLLLTIALLLGLGFLLMGELKFLIPFKLILYHQYGRTILLWFAILFGNLFAAVYALHRKFFLKDTGRKLSHLDRQVTTGDSPVPTPFQEEENQ